MRIGMVAYATKQGLGYLAKSFYDAGIVDEVILIYHGRNTTYPEWYQNRAVSITRLPIRGKAVNDLLGRVDLMLFFETAFDWSFLKVCKARGVKTICMPMHEWFPVNCKNAFDGYLCPSLLDVDYFPGSPLFQPPVDPSTWKLRITAKRFLHNAGNVGHRNHKGTLELLKATEYIESDLTVTIRCQNQEKFNRLVQQVPEVESNPAVTIERGEIPYADLHKDYDAVVIPEKFNGLSLPLQEAYAAGMLVITTARYPANTWLPTEPLIPVESYHQAAITDNYLTFQEAVVNPREIAKTMDAWYDRDITGYSQKAKRWAEVNSWVAKKDTCLKLLGSFL